MTTHVCICSSFDCKLAHLHKLTYKKIKTILLFNFKIKGISPLETTSKTDLFRHPGTTNIIMKRVITDIKLDH